MSKLSGRFISILWFSQNIRTLTNLFFECFEVIQLERPTLERAIAEISKWMNNFTVFKFDLKYAIQLANQNLLLKHNFYNFFFVFAVLSRILQTKVWKYWRIFSAKPSLCNSSITCCANKWCVKEKVKEISHPNLVYLQLLQYISVPNKPNKCA